MLVMTSWTTLMVTKGNSTMPRKSSTNTRSLSKRIAKIERENNPVIQIHGQRYQSQTQKVPIRRKINLTFNLGTGTNQQPMTGSVLGSLGLADGIRILDVKAINRSGRRIAISVPSDSRLCYFGPNGSPTGLSREAWAPLSRFPSITLNVPDVVSATIDTNDATLVLFTIIGDTSLQSQTLTATITYIDYV